MSSLPVPSLRHWLESILLPQYLDVLTDSGYDTLYKCAELTSSDLDRIGISLPGHKKRILSHLVKFNLEPRCHSNESAETTKDNSLSVTVLCPKLAGISEEHQPVYANLDNFTLVFLSNVLAVIYISNYIALKIGMNEWTDSLCAMANLVI